MNDFIAIAACLIAITIALLRMRPMPIPKLMTTEEYQSCQNWLFAYIDIDDPPPLPRNVRRTSEFIQIDHRGRWLAVASPDLGNGVPVHCRPRHCDNQWNKRDDTPMARNRFHGGMDWDCTEIHISRV